MGSAAAWDGLVHLSNNSPLGQLAKPGTTRVDFGGKYGFNELHLLALS